MNRHYEEYHKTRFFSPRPRHDDGFYERESKYRLDERSSSSRLSRKDYHSHQRHHHQHPHVDRSDRKFSNSLIEQPNITKEHNKKQDTPEKQVSSPLEEENERVMEADWGNESDDDSVVVDRQEPVNTKQDTTTCSNTTTESEWTTHFTEKGDKYYHNKVTRETVWKIPTTSTNTTPRTQSLDNHKDKYTSSSRPTFTNRHTTPPPYKIRASRNPPPIDSRPYYNRYRSPSPRRYRYYDRPLSPYNIRMYDPLPPFPPPHRMLYEPSPLLPPPPPSARWYPRERSPQRYRYDRNYR